MQRFDFRILRKEGVMTTLDHIVVKNIVATMRQSGSYCCDNGNNGDNGDNGKSRDIISHIIQYISI